jgi:hypothetical protein
MNKNIIVSSVAAAALAAVLTGCGSDSASTSTGGSSVSGTATKAPLGMATVTIGGQTVKTNSSGRFNATGVSLTDGYNRIVVSGGYEYYGTAQEKEFKDTLKLDYNASSSVEPKIDYYTTFVAEQVDMGIDRTVATNKAVALKGAPLDSEVKDGTQAEAFGKVIKDLAECAKSLDKKSSDVITYIANQLSSSLTDTQFKTIVSNTITNYGLSSCSNKAVLDKVIDNKTLPGRSLSVFITDDNASASFQMFTIDNSIMLDGNASADDSNASVFYQNGVSNSDATISSGWSGLKTVDTNETNELNVTASNFNSNESLVKFKFVDFNSTYANTDNYNGKLILDFAKSNANTSYTMVLEGLKLDLSSGKLALATNANTSLIIGANSNNSTSFGSSAQALSTIGLASSDDNSTKNSIFYNNIDGNNSIGINIAKFANYVKDYGSGLWTNNATNGNYSVEMVSNSNTSMFATGNYSMKVLVNLDEMKASHTSAYYDLSTDSVKIEGKPYSGYKVIDTKLVIQ